MANQHVYQSRNAAHFSEAPTLCEIRLHHVHINKSFPSSKMHVGLLFPSVSSKTFPFFLLHIFIYDGK
ncbi:hypothetical protein HBI56_091960 [Parastagonospora nodorum]|uniref:Uncharacterized protein n=1 Tax=Phaeosphaeria nodorum (strain SN15 / ATCC MYA-4574 / FGSC 10173) TaxID=321614 RepID=A0A7U2F5H2_PHANO|nr:hypothetical protein HBH56_087050 [Parastagonospora nodorum]QRC97968.1 hypothetical protein JI435_411300 [Parastagonospora nodorum SN15]KAH3921215.1 hypothetical protein HBH54_243870 [Parastagonospora nodorum]KAH3945637.1 hypothetical protein HBH53_139110 [Parastagonospora nodorum]KAH3956735.1 hypothetical protein HBH51_236210 [Parastagonospora nodorum]